MISPMYVFMGAPRWTFAVRGFRACLFLLLLFAVPAASWGVPPAERSALIDLYDSTGGPGWANSAGWNGPPGSECTWYGVLCDAEGSVQELNLAVNQLAGTLPASLGQLTHLTNLLLLGNQLTGNIPPEIGNLESLVVLALELNQLSGGIPSSLGDLSSLEWLSAGANQLSGSLPPELGNLANLQSLSLGGNHLSGSIPPELGDLTQLVRLNLAKNELTGGIPVELGTLANLRLFLLGENRLSGSLPAELGNLTALQNFVVSSNLLTGGIPAALGNLAQVQDMDLSFNHFSGSIPPALGGLTQVRFLQLAGNQLTGEIPGELQNLTQLVDRDPSGSGGLNLHYNALYNDNPVLDAFLDAKHAAPDWRSTQTVAPADLAAGAATATSLTLSWTPVAYTADTGGYVVRYSTVAGGPYTFFTRTASKSASSVVVTGLAPATTYHFILSTVTDPHGGNPNTVSSEVSAEVAATTEGNTPAGSAVVVQPVDSTTGTAPATLTFATVAQGGSTTLTTRAAGPAPPAGFQLGVPPTCFELSTTAVFTGTVAVCLDYTGVSFVDETQLRLLHFESGAWVDITTSLDTAQDVLCGATTSLSPFLVAERAEVAVRIDIKPGSDPNRINLRSQGKLPVAIFSAAGFDAIQVDPETVNLAHAPVEVKPSGRLMVSFEDVDGDGRLDLLVHFRTSSLQLAPGDTSAVLTGRTTAGVRIRGVDAVRVVP